jgi:hypothetical protein
MHFVFLFFCMFPLIHRLHFVLLYFSFFWHALKEQNRESTNVCCMSLLLMILAPWVLHFFVSFGFVFLVFLMITKVTGCRQHPTTQLYCTFHDRNQTTSNANPQPSEKRSWYGHTTVKNGNSHGQLLGVPIFWWDDHTPLIPCSLTMAHIMGRTPKDELSNRIT